MQAAAVARDEERFRLHTLRQRHRPARRSPLLLNGNGETKHLDKHTVSKRYHLLMNRLQGTKDQDWPWYDDSYEANNLPTLPLRTMSEFDTRTTCKNTVIAGLSVLSVVAAITALQVGWDGEVFDEDSIYVVGLEGLVSLCTLLLVYCVYDLARYEADLDRVRFAVYEPVSVLSSDHKFRWMLETLVHLGHTIPYITDHKWNLMVFLRLYTLIRFFRDRADIYRWRRQIILSGRLRFGVPSFDSVLALRAKFRQRPWTFVVSVTATSLVGFGYALYITERQAQPELFTMGSSMYLASATMSTVGYGDLTPITDLGQFVAMIAALVGLMLGALIITALLRSLEMPANQKLAAETCLEAQNDRKQRELAARVLQAALRLWYLKVRERKRTLGSHRSSASIVPANPPAPPAMRMEETANTVHVQNKEILDYSDYEEIDIEAGKPNDTAPKRSGTGIVFRLSGGDGTASDAKANVTAPKLPREHTAKAAKRSKKNGLNVSKDMRVMAHSIHKHLNCCQNCLRQVGLFSCSMCDFCYESYARRARLLYACQRLRKYRYARVIRKFERHDMFYSGITKIENDLTSLKKENSELMVTLRSLRTDIIMLAKGQTPPSARSEDGKTS